MENTGVGKEKEKFVPRKNYEEFYRDGEVIEDLFEWTDGLMANEYNIPYGEYTLQVFNHAYRICWMIIHENSSVIQISESIVFENDVVRKFSFEVAYVLYILHEKFYKIDERIRRGFLCVLPRGFYMHRYHSFVREKELFCPIEFLAPIPDIDLAQTKDDIMAAMNKAVRLEKGNKMLHKRLELERTKRAEAEQKIKTLQEKLDAWENNDFYKAVNIDSIVNYVNEQRRNLTEHDVLVIQGMLNRLCRNKKLSDEAFKEIDNLTCGSKVGIHNNTGCQNFYGPITDSEFPSKNNSKLDT